MLMRELIYDPRRAGKRMTIVCFVSGSGTNYREIVKHGPDHDYLVFSNRPECSALEIARQFHHKTVELSHIDFLKSARLKYGPGKIPADCPERLAYEQEAVRLIDASLTKKPDLICLAGYDLWHTTWFINKYFPHIINVHPGDTVKGYAGLHWIPAARAIIAGEDSLRSTTFIVDQGGDTGPVLAQSDPLYIRPFLEQAQKASQSDLIKKYEQIDKFITTNGISTLDEFNKNTNPQIKSQMEVVCRTLQDGLKEAGDWKIYPYVIHELIAHGRIAIEGRQIFVDDQVLPVQGYRIDHSG